jgi:hypothetical protein
VSTSFESRGFGTNTRKAVKKGKEKNAAKRLTSGGGMTNDGGGMDDGDYKYYIYRYAPIFMLFYSALFLFLTSETRRRQMLLVCSSCFDSDRKNGGNIHWHK